MEEESVKQKFTDKMDLVKTDLNVLKFYVISACEQASIMAKHIKEAEQMMEGLLHARN